MGVRWGGKAGIYPLEIDFLLRNTLILLYKLQFCIILPLPEVYTTLEIGHGTHMYAGFITNVNRRSNNINQHAINALETMKKEDEYSNYVANKTTKMKDSNAVYIYIQIHSVSWAFE